jgi:hypothetical protein
MSQAFRPRWAGIRATATQALDWPRFNVPRHDSPTGYYAYNTVPGEVRNACSEMAFKAAFGELNADLGQAKSSVQIGPIKTDYAQGSTASKRYVAIEQMLRPTFAATVGGSVTLVRC